MAEGFIRKCPFCAGDMLRSKQAGHIVFTPPWAGILNFSAPKNRAFPWACMGCGVVLYYLESLPILAAEYRERATAASKTHSSAAPIKP